MTADPCTEAVTYAELLAANVRSARARADISQRVLAQRMDRLGYGWKHQTVGKIENCNRPLFAAELLGLAVALNTTVTELTGAREGDQPVALPGEVLLEPAASDLSRCKFAS
jgi:transcriptional regulator with XRE-family HTH domain